MDDILIRGGQLIDGTGAPARVADVAIRAGRIVAIEADRADSAARVMPGLSAVSCPIRSRSSQASVMHESRWERACVIQSLSGTRWTAEDAAVA